MGIDLDDDRPIGAAAARELMTDEEIEAVLAQGWTRDLDIARNLAFLAKESLFKYQYPLTRKRELEFDEVRLRASERAGVMAAASTTADSALQKVLTSARIYHQEIQGLRICWTLSS